MEPVSLLDVVRIATFQPRPGRRQCAHWEVERAARLAEQATAEHPPKAERIASRESARPRWFRLSFLAR